MDALVKLLFALGLALAVITTKTAVADDVLHGQLGPDAEAAAIASAESVGKTLFRHDQAAWVATDAMRRIRGFKRNKSIRGWITVESTSGGIDVVFFGELENANLAEFYRVAISSSNKLEGKPLIVSTPKPLEGRELAAATARMLAATAKFTPCGDSYNTVVLPLDGNIDRWSVYLIPGTKKRNVVPLGGTYRVDVELSTGEVQIRPYTKTCIELQNDPKAVGLMVTHLLDPVPTEVHVFWSMWADKAIYVATPPHGNVWAVQGAAVRLVKRGAPES